MRVASGKRDWESLIFPLMHECFIEPYTVGLMENVKGMEEVDNFVKERKNERNLRVYESSKVFLLKAMSACHSIFLCVLKNRDTRV